MPSIRLELPPRSRLLACSPILLALFWLVACAPSPRESASAPTIAIPIGASASATPAFTATYISTTTTLPILPTVAAAAITVSTMPPTRARNQAVTGQPPVLIAVGPGSSVKNIPLVSKPGQISIAARPTKVTQLIGDYDAERKQSTQNRTFSRFKLESSDLGIPFTHKGRTYLLFGDSFGGPGGDAIAYATNRTPESGLLLDFMHDARGTYRPILIPGITQGGFEVPTEGVSIGGGMYVYHTTDASQGPHGQVMGRSVVALSTDDGRSFRYLYDLSRGYFINVSVVTVESSDWQGLPQKTGSGLVTFGSGDYRRSNVYLAFQPTSGIGSRSGLRYWSGLDRSGTPTWSDRERDSRALFDQPCIGEFSVSYNRFVRKWLMLYNCGNPRGINLRTADQPWGPWTEPLVIFDPWLDGGYCHFMHVPWSFRKCDSVQDPEQEEIWGGEYGPYQFEDLAIGDAFSTTIYFTMSTWNPYTVVLMKSTLRLGP